MNENELRRRVVREVARAGGLRALAREWGVSPAYLSCYLNGTMRAGEKIAAKLGLTAVRTISYRYEPVAAGR